MSERKYIMGASKSTPVNNIKCKSCDAPSTEKHKAEKAVDGNFYCPDHICYVCTQRPNGLGHGKAFCSKCVCDCGMPKTSSFLQKCSSCLEKNHKEASMIVIEEYYAKLSWAKDATNICKFEKNISRAGNLNNVESVLVNEITSFFNGATSLSVQTFVSVLCKSLSDGLSSAIGGIDNSWKDIAKASHSSVMESKVEATLTGGDVNVRVAMFFHSVVFNISIQEVSSSGPTKPGELTETEVLMLSGEKIKKECVIVHCTGVLSIWTQELMPSV